MVSPLSLSKGDWNFWTQTNQRSRKGSVKIWAEPPSPFFRASLSRGCYIFKTKCSQNPPHFVLVTALSLICPAEHAPLFYHRPPNPWLGSPSTALRGQSFTGRTAGKSAMKSPQLISRKWRNGVDAKFVS